MDRVLAPCFGVLLACGSHAAAQVLPVTPYLSINDSPFASTTFAQFYLEDFEDGLFNVPGVTGVSNTPGTALHVYGPAGTTDSVDADDGAIDGSGTGGHDLAAVPDGTEQLGYSFDFDANVLGGLPTHVGIVWTDGSPSRACQVEFFGLGGVLLGTASAVVGDGSFTGGTAEDRFFGAAFAQGVESFTIRSPGGVHNLTVDHLQYGIVPTPGSAALVGLAGIAAARRRRG